MSEYSRVVPPEGSKNSKIAFVGEAPSYNEILQGRPFVGRAGQQFNDFLLHARIPRTETYITNLFKVQVSKRNKPREQYFSQNTMLFDSLKGFTEEGMEQVKELHEELKSGAFNIVIPMGNPATYAILEKSGITKWRGSILWSDLIEKKCMPTIHPAATLRQYMYKHLIIADFRKAREQGEFPEIKAKQRDYVLEPSFLDATAYLKALRQLKQFAFDIEVMRGEVSCISFSADGREGFVVPFHMKGQPYFTPDQEMEVWSLIAEALGDERIKKVGQNLVFDTSFLFEKYGIVTKNIDDTMIAHRLTYPDYPAGLDFITSMYTDIPYYKNEGKQYIKWGGSEQDFLLYNAKDSVVCIEAMPQLREDMEKLGSIETYEMQKSLVEPITFMGLRGLRVDEEGMAKAKDRATRNFDRYQRVLNSMAGTDLNPNSPKQVATYFYVHKGLQPYKKDGTITTNDGAMKRIARKGYKEARVILKMRHLRKMIGTYYEVKLKDGRLRCSYSPVTGMGRLSSSEDIFGYGTNMQNQPKDMDRFFTADDDYLIYNVDLSQADNRSVAYIAPEPRMIKAFEDKVDVHSLTASLVFGIPYDEVIDMHKRGVKSELGYGEMTHRDWGKRLNHALNFGMGYKLFSYMLEIQEKEGKGLVEAYHHAYPGVRQSYHRWVRDQLSKNRTLTNAFGRKYLFLDRWGDQLFNQAYSFIPQSNTADIINRRGIIPIYYYQQDFGKVELLRQVHDSINFQIPLDAGLSYHIEVLRKIKKRLEEPIVWKTYSFVIPAEFKVGTRLDPMQELDLNDSPEDKLKEYFKREGK